MPIDDVLNNIVDVKRRVAMIPYSPNQTAATKEALSLAVAAMEYLAQIVAEIDDRTRPQAKAATRGTQAVAP